MKKFKVSLLAALLLTGLAAAPNAFALGQLRSMAPQSQAMISDAALAIALVGPGL